MLELQLFHIIERGPWWYMSYPLELYLLKKKIKSKLFYNSIWFVEWYTINSLVPGICGSNFQHIIFKLIIQNISWGTSYEISLK